MAFVVGAWVVCIPVAYVLAFWVEPTKGLLGLWLGMACGYLTVTAISAAAVYKSDWDAVAVAAAQRAEAKYSRAPGSDADAAAENERGERAPADRSGDDPPAPGRAADLAVSSVGSLGGAGNSLQTHLLPAGRQDR